MSDVVIVGAKRTAIGSFLGQFTGVPTPALGTAVITGALEHAGVAPDQVDEVIMGCVLPAGLGQAPARQAALGAGLPASAGCTTINKVCGSGMKAIMLGHDLIKAGSANVIVAGGMESMTNAPHLLNGSRTGVRYGSGELLDHLAWDGLTNPYDGKAMGVFGECDLLNLWLRSRRAGCLLGRERASRAGGRIRRCFQGRNRSGHGQGPQRRCRRRYRRRAGKDRPGQDSDAARGVRQGRRAHCGLLFEDLRWRRRDGTDERR